MELVQYELEIKREVEVLPGNSRSLGVTEFSFSFNGDNLAEGDQCIPTGFGYKALVTMLTSAISELSRSAAEQGMSEGEIIGDAIGQLQRNLIDPDRVIPKFNNK